MVVIVESEHDFKKFKETTVERTCPRCGNTTKWWLYRDQTGIGWFGIRKFHILIPTKSYYALGCAICPAKEKIDKDYAKYLIGE